MWSTAVSSLVWFLLRGQVNGSDGNKSKMLRSRPRPRTRPISQQQHYMSKKNSCVATRNFVIKNNFVQKTSKSDMISSYTWHCFSIYCTKKYRCLLHFSIIMSHSTCRAEQCWKQDQKYKTKIKTKTKIVRPRWRTRPMKQEQDYIRSALGILFNDSALYKCLLNNNKNNT